ncbi:MAG: tetratricopeptide repeat protein [Elusimicrobia bacterium]|nr:tetratricopeptide repeat protein [Elusimicrobiota bacterium]
MTSSSARRAASGEGFSAWRLAAILGLMAAAALPYAATVLHPPVWDDIPFVFHQDFLMDCGNIRRVASAEGFLKVLPFPNSARPVWLASVLADTCLGSGKTYAYRLSSIFWHSVAAALLAFLAWILTRDRGVSVAAGLLFAAHPVHTEVVNIISFRTDLLALCFMLAGLIAYREGLSGRGWRRRALAALSAPLFGLALLSKETAVVFPLLALLCDAAFPGPGPAADRRRWRAGLLAAYAAFIGAYLVFRSPRSGYVMAGHQDLLSELRTRVVLPFSDASGSRSELDQAGSRRLDPPPWAAVYEDAGARLLTMSRIFGSYMRLLVWPHPLASDYAPPVVRSWLDPWVWLGWASLAGLLAAARLLARDLPLASVGLLWIPVALLPVSGLITIYNIQAERYLFIASAGACAAAAALGAAAVRRFPAPRRKAAAAAALGLVLAPAVYITVLRNRDYASAQAFFEAAKAADPGLARMRLGLALTYAANGDVRRADSEFRAAVDLRPEHVGARLSYGAFLLREKRLAEALSQLETAADLAPTDPDTLFRLGIAEWLSEKPSAALGHLRSAAVLAPGMWVAREFAGAVLLEQGRAGEAAAELLVAARASEWRSAKGLYHLMAASRKAGLSSQAKQAEQALERLRPDLAARARGPRPRVLRPTNL